MEGKEWEERGRKVKTGEGKREWKSKLQDEEGKGSVWRKYTLSSPGTGYGLISTFHLVMSSLPFTINNLPLRYIIPPTVNKEAYYLLFASSHIVHSPLKSFTIFPLLWISEYPIKYLRR